jgi:cell division protein FtsB
MKKPSLKSLLVGGVAILIYAGTVAIGLDQIRERDKTIASQKLKNDSLKSGLADLRKDAEKMMGNTSEIEDIARQGLKLSQQLESNARLQKVASKASDLVDLTKKHEELQQRGDQLKKELDRCKYGSPEWDATVAQIRSVVKEMEAVGASVKQLGK